MSVYRRSVTNCVSFPCVVYFCLFSPLKDRYAFSICLQLLGASPPYPTAALPLDQLPSSRPPVLSPLSKFLATPLNDTVSYNNNNTAYKSNSTQHSLQNSIGCIHKNACGRIQPKSLTTTLLWIIPHYRKRMPVVMNNSIK